MSAKIVALFLIILIDSICEYFANFVDYQTLFVSENAINTVNEKIYTISGLIANTIQFITQVSLLIWIFFLFWKTFLFRSGLIR